MQKFLLTAFTLMMASTAFANSYLYVDDFYVQRNMMDTGEKIVVPVRAHFDARVQSWEMTVTLPFGLSLESVVKGQDMAAIPYVNASGSTSYSNCTLQIFGDQYVGTASWNNEGYWIPDDSGELESYGLVKWEAGDYEEMLQLIFYAYSDFEGGEVYMSTTVYSTDDARGGTVNENGDAGHGYTYSVYWDAEERPTTPEPIITFEPNEYNMGVNVSVEGEGLVRAEIWINDLLYDVYDVSDECPGVSNWYIEREYFQPKHIEVTATAQLPGYLPSTVIDDYYLEEIPPIESPVPIISYEIYENHALVWANFDESLPYNPYVPEREGEYPEWNDQYVLLLDGEYVNNPYWVDRPEPGEGDLTLNFSAYSWVYNGTPSEYAYLTVVIPQKACFIEVDGITYNITGMNEVSVWADIWGSTYGGDVVIPESVMCEGITYTVIGIGTEAFYFSGGLTSVTIPATVTTIGELAFGNCADLMTITCHALTPPSIVADNFVCDYTGVDLYEQTHLFVPNESLEAYQSHEEWGRFTRIVPFLGVGPGDMNGDGSINISDVTNIINLISTGAADELPAYCDMNGDGQVNISDVIMLISAIVGGQ